ncbi:hypothetical protein [Niveibacterium umoris]|uniref:Uncharacterized protein n=1 Tax=Niveibacterium umoris TaxID=1193620 RepID=A0A840BG98_9RHOO|nr:hypothetical protein [Niveibacterium umoris]MBB4011693.1 hypothetical protein [Niveibacterium umoris]
MSEVFVVIQYQLPGSARYQERIFPKPALLEPATRKKLGLKTYADVIAHFTASSLAEDGIGIVTGSLRVDKHEGRYRVSFEPAAGYEAQARQFADMHVAMLDERHFGLALKGADACKRTPAWNPMAGYPVNRSDGPSEWLPCLPLGMPIANHRAVTLMHYPPIVAYRTADYLNNMTLRRWAQLLTCVGITETSLYHSILDVNPIAAPGSGESEYPNDYFPISLTSQFYDDEKKGLNYVRAMLELMLDPPSNRSNPLTLPLLVCGSPLYDPQAPGWFRTRYKDQLPKDKNGSPTVDVLQVGLVRLHPDSAKLTPYMIANHMIAAGVTGECTSDPSKIPNIQKYEAQDLVAATWLSLYADALAQGKPFDPAAAKAQACQRWFGAADGEGAPNPPDANDTLTICALAQMDLCFDPVKIAPMYSFDEAVARCKQAGGASLSPCFGCKPLGSAA